MEIFIKVVSQIFYRYQIALTQSIFKLETCSLHQNGYTAGKTSAIYTFTVEPAASLASGEVLRVNCSSSTFFIPQLDQANQWETGSTCVRNWRASIQFLVLTWFILIFVRNAAQ